MPKAVTFPSVLPSEQLAPIAWPTFGLIVFWIVDVTTKLDFRVARYFYDSATGTFPARNAYWAEGLLHRRGRDFVAAIGILTLITLAVTAFKPATRRIRNLRRIAGFMLLCLLLGSGAVAGLKKVTNVDCPWDLTFFGGDRPYFGLFALRPPGIPRGECFPGGHSSGAFGLLGAYFVAREYSPFSGLATLVAVLGLGTLFSAAQWARGAHFPTHDASSAYLCWIISYALYQGPYSGRLLRDST